MVKREERGQSAVQYHAQGYNCCQSVLLACCDLSGMDEKTAERLGYGFSGGMHCGEVCGAVTGGLMAIGCSMPDQATQENRPLAIAASKEFEAGFRAEFETLLCRDIIQANGGKRACNSCIACGAACAADVIEKLKRGEYRK